MGKHLNDPKINRKYNYLYKITNKVNSKIYIGVHRTDILDDGYMGSGKLLKRSIEKYGIENFTKDIIEFFEIYKDALNAERKIVSMEFIESDDNYNIKEGGYGNCGWSSSMIRKMSETTKQLWRDPEYQKKMKLIYESKERNFKVSEGIVKWIKCHPEEHQAKMLKINQNPEKIKKTAEKHRGMKRSDETKKKQSESKRRFIEQNGTKAFGKDMMYIHNPSTGKRKRVEKAIDIPEGWFRGMGKQNKSRENYHG
jgi:hypothetical protein